MFCIVSGLIETYAIFSLAAPFISEKFPSLSMTMISLLIAVNSAVFTVSSPLAVTLIDKYGRKNTLIFAMMIKVAFNLMTASFSYIND
jgi:MFS family permease